MTSTPPWAASRVRGRVGWAPAPAPQGSAGSGRHRLAIPGSRRPDPGCHFSTWPPPTLRRAAPKGAEVPTAYAADLEAASFPTVDDIVTVVKATLGK
jgi:hypothetical protein